MNTNQTKSLSLTLKQAEKDFVLKEDDRGFIIAGVARDKTWGNNYSEIIIPQIIEGRPVFKIEERAFRNCDNTYRVSLPEGIEEIGEEAFAYCTSLSQISFPSTLRKIGLRAFWCCAKLSEIKIPKGVTELGIGFLNECTNLTSIVVDPENPVYDSRVGCNAIIETKTNTLHSGCSATVIPGDTVALGEWCFYGMPISAITIPEGVVEIGFLAFSRDGYKYDKNSKSVLTTVNLPKSLKIIDKDAFSDQKKLKKIVLPEGLAVIGSGAFSYSGLERIVIPDSITRLEEYTFTGCDKLKKIYIPESVTFFGNNLFPFKAMIEKGSVIEGKAGSEAEKFAKKKKLTFVAK